MVEAEQSKAARFRETAKAIRETAAHAHDSAVRGELLVLADRYDRMAERADRKGNSG